MLRSFVAGQVLLREGDVADVVYVILSGAVRVYRRNGPTNQDAVVELAKLGPGDVIGELAPILGMRRTATVQALEPTQVVTLSIDKLKTLTRQQAPLSRVVALALRERSGLSEEEIVTLAARLGLVLPRAPVPTEPEVAQNLARLPAPQYDKSVFYTKRLECPACGAQFTTLVVHTRKDQPKDSETDFHKTYTTPYNPYDYELWVCPNDLYAAFPADFGDLREAQRSQVA
jgi:CRP-like cAMP-binding protein